MSEFERTAGGAIFMDGKRLRDETVARLAEEITELGSPEICLATVLVGDDRPSRLYVNSKHKKAQESGMISRHVELDATASQAQVEDAVGALADDESVHGILVQLPLPSGLDEEAVLDLVPADKDVDGLTERSMGRLVRGKPG
ncbi:MAG: tetrahydrofolate dehydrogenase/cyclohydrolase catalytic domain-containing protein, partial [Actinomycetota bacterium]|nr:tetrahydrofolate dehydrogenase/cyclohydrolase catalytic domain-containing protein [Actinomycetota bacterium]